MADSGANTALRTNSSWYSVKRHIDLGAVEIISLRRGCTRMNRIITGRDTNENREPLPSTLRVKSLWRRVSRKEQGGHSPAASGSGQPPVSTVAGEQTSDAIELSKFDLGKPATWESLQITAPTTHGLSKRSISVASQAAPSNNTEHEQDSLHPETSAHDIGVGLTTIGQLAIVVDDKDVPIMRRRASVASAKSSLDVKKCLDEHSTPAKVSPDHTPGSSLIARIESFQFTTVMSTIFHVAPDVQAKARATCNNMLNICMDMERLHKIWREFTNSAPCAGILRFMQPWTETSLNKTCATKLCRDMQQGISSYHEQIKNLAAYIQQAEDVMGQEWWVNCTKMMKAISNLDLRDLGLQVEVIEAKYLGTRKEVPISPVATKEHQTRSVTFQQEQEPPVHCLTRAKPLVDDDDHTVIVHQTPSHQPSRLPFKTIRPSSANFKSFALNTISSSADSVLEDQPVNMSQAPMDSAVVAAQYYKDLIGSPYHRRSPLPKEWVPESEGRLSEQGSLLNEERKNVSRVHAML